MALIDKKEADFMGNWMLPIDGEQQKIRKKCAGISTEEYKMRSGFGEGFFYMFIENRENIGQGNLEKISGKIKDAYGEALFEGELGKFSIKFVKKYCENSDVKINYEIPYEGTFNVEENMFFGKYAMKGEKEPWQGMFVLMPIELIKKEYFKEQIN